MACKEKKMHDGNQIQMQEFCIWKVTKRFEERDSDGTLIKLERGGSTGCGSHFLAHDEVPPDRICAGCQRTIRVEERVFVRVGNKFMEKKEEKKVMINSVVKEGPGFTGFVFPCLLQSEDKGLVILALGYWSQDKTRIMGINLRRTQKPFELSEWDIEEEGLELFTGEISLANFRGDHV
jgi:hypothetical protein